MLDIGPIDHMTRREMRKYGVWAAQHRDAQRPNAPFRWLLSWLGRFWTDRLA
jgi:hypothetical protein